MILDFVINNYLWFLVISLIVIFTLIGYLVDMMNINKKEPKKKVKPIAIVKDDTRQVHPSVEVYTNEDFDNPLIEDKNS